MEKFLKNFHAVGQLLHKMDPETLSGFEKLRQLSSTSMVQKLKVFRALFGEGLMFYAHTSKSKNSVGSVRAQLALVAGEQIDRAQVQPALLKRAEELTEG